MATLTRGTASQNKSFSVLIKKNEIITDADAVYADKQALAIGYARGTTHLP